MMKLKNINTRRIMGGTLAMMISTAPSYVCLSSEFDILAEDEPKTSYYIDDATALSRTARDQINSTLYDLEARTGYKLVVVTTRKLEFDPDAFSISEKIFNKWHKTDKGSKNGLLLIVTSGKEGALVGGDSFRKAVGEDIIDSVSGENIPGYTEEEKFNEAAISSINRIVAVLDGKNDPGPPIKVDKARTRTYKTKEETERVKPVTSAIVLTLLFIAFVVPMLQFYGYVSKD